MKRFMRMLGVILLILCLAGNTGATGITQSVYATLTGYRFFNMEDPDLDFVLSSTMIGILDMTYDDAGTEFFEYYDPDVNNDSGGIYKTWGLSDWPDSSILSDASFTLGGFLERIIGLFTEYERINNYCNSVMKNDGLSPVQFWVNSDILEIQGAVFPEFNQSFIFVWIFGEGGAELELEFGSPSLLVNGPLNPVPEPATMLLLGSGLIGIAGIRKKLRRS